MSFKTQVEGITSISIGTTPTDAEFSQFLNDGVIEVTSRIVSLRPDMMEDFLRESSEQTSNGFNPGTAKIFSVIRESGVNGEWLPCRKESIGLQYKVKDPNSLSYASKFNPVYMVTQNRNIHVYPEPGSSNDGFKVLYVNSSPEETDGTALEHSSTGIKWFPEDKVYLVVLYASFRTIHAKLASMDITAFPAIGFTAFALTSVVPSPISSPSFTTPNAALQNAVGNFTDAVAASFTNYNGGSIIDIPAALTTFDSSFSTAAPDVNTLFTKGASLPNPTLTYDPIIAAQADGLNDILSEISSIAVPTLDNIAMTLESWTHSETASSAISSLQSGTFPSPPSLASDFFSVNFAQDVDGNPMSMPTVFNPDSTTESSVEAPIDNTELQGIDWRDYNSAVSSEDFEEAATHLTKISQMLAIKEGDFNRNMESYKEKVLKIIEKQANTEDKQWAADLSKYQADINGYQAEVNLIFTRYEKDFQVLQAEYNSVNSQKLNKYQADLSQALNKFNKEKVEYDAKVRAITDRANNNFQKITANIEAQNNVDELNALNEYKQQYDQYEQDLRKYSESVAAYSAQVNSEMQEYNANLDREVQGWTNRQQNILQWYETKINDTNSLFQANLSQYQAKLQMQLANLEQTANSQIQKMQLSTNVDLQNKAQVLQKEVQEYSAKVSEYQAELQSYQMEVSAEVQEYGQKIAHYSASLQEYQGNMQVLGTEYQWLQDQYARIKAEYDGAFSLMAPRQQGAS